MTPDLDPPELGNEDGEFTRLLARCRAAAEAEETEVSPWLT